VAVIFHTSGAPRSQGLRLLLALLDGDPEHAAGEFEALRRRLVGFFEWRGAPWPEELADEVLDRLMRRLEEGEAVGNVAAFASGVARRLLLELHRGPRVVPLGNLGAEPAAPGPPPEPPWAEAEAQLDACLARLPAEHREILLAYYRGEGAERIAARQDLAHRLGVSANGLRVRVFRLRQRLEACVRERLRHGGLVAAAAQRPPSAGEGG
jgi:DNA-directed RNA polymerase specialized sigma24 family protein